VRRGFLCLLSDHERSRNPAGFGRLRGSRGPDRKEEEARDRHDERGADGPGNSRGSGEPDADRDPVPGDGRLFRLQGQEDAAAVVAIGRVIEELFALPGN
jgi:hypothetical protein